METKLNDITHPINTIKASIELLKMGNITKTDQYRLYSIIQEKANEINNIFKPDEQCPPEVVSGFDQEV